MRLKKIMILAVIVLLLGTTGYANTEAVAAETSKQIVTVNIQDILLGSEAGQEVKKVLEEKVGEFQNKFQQEQEEINTLRAEIEKKGSVWSTEVREEKERDYQKRVREMQIKSEDAQFELQQLEKQVMSPVLNELQKVIEEVGEKNGYAMILDSRDGLLYVDKSLDISEMVKRELDARQKAEKESK
ncbi:MAG: OmpH family outer membrane protein [Deltaproteobacteria bacterium]|jgi:outer membrane protein|nr:OmpH family outer membrane protein [Deltaproteobacteria bacterium]